MRAANQFELSIQSVPNQCCVLSRFYGLKIRTNFLHYTCFSACSILSYLSASYIMATEAAFYFCSHKCCSQMFTVISLRVGGLASLSVTSQKDELNDIIAMHVDALQCVKLLDRNTKFSSLVQITNCVLMWCSMGVYLTYVISRE